MWTHKRPYQISRLTRKSIHYHGAVGLYRALNIGRLVAFVGSGVTVAYGRPTWQKLVESAYEYIKLHYDEEKSSDPKTHRMGYVEWLGLGDQKDADQTAIRGLEELRATLDVFYEAHANAANPDGELLKIILEICENIAQTMDLYARRVGKRSFLAAGLRQHICKQLITEHDHESDPIALIHQELRIKRLLTVNYDVEIERYLYKNGFSSQPLGGKDISTLIGNKLKPILGDFLPRDRDTRHHPMFNEQAAQLVARDNLGRTVASTRLTESSIADLIGFATNPRPYEAQIFHLHGRLDDPKSLIVTEGDYQRIYLRSGPTQRTFQEALDTLFLGNDVLFIGLGMNEADLLRPLRQFVVTDSLADVEARRIFALLPFTGEQQATQQALDLKIRYGVQAHFFGDGLNWLMREALQTIWTCIQLLEKRRQAAEKDNQLESLFKNIWELNGTRLDEIFSKYQKHSKETEADNPAADESGDEARRKFESAFSELLSIKALQGTVPKLLKNDLSVLTDAFLSADACKAFKSELKKQISELQTNGLCNALKLIAAAQSAWWEDWLAEPEPRRAPYAYLPKSARSNVPEVCVRHRPAYKRPGTKNSTPLVHAIRLMRKSCNSANRRILRLTNKRGGGKGSFFHELQMAGKFTQLFPQTSEGTYAGAFFAHTSFSPEFSSVIAALVRFVARHTATDSDLARVIKHRSDLKGMNGSDLFEQYPQYLCEGPGDEWTPLWRDDDVPNTLSQLRKVFGRLKKFHEVTDKTRNRLFICLNGLEQLCDRQGDAYSSAHRVFFSILTAEEFASLPIDLVLIAGDPDQPTRVLSKPTPNGPEPWSALPRLPFGERYWLHWPGSGQRYVTTDDKGDLASAPTLKKLIEESVALDTWVSLCARECFDASRLAEPQRAELLQAKKRWIAQLEHAAARERYFHILTEIFLTYRQFDRNAIRRTQEAKKEPLTDEHDMRELILHHLSLFSLPVQASALIKCPLIRRLLLRLQNQEKAKPKPADGTSGEADEQKDTDFTEGALDEREGMNKLRSHLEVLHRRGLIIVVYPTRVRRDKAENAAASHNNKDELKPYWKDEKSVLQLRFTLHGRMRQFLAHQMRFALPDRGERNYYGATLYTVQPRDLPTPSEVHFRRVFGIVEELLYSARNLLQPFYEKNRELEDLPEDHEIHAMGHRLRAAYSILRESFSIGSLSRLKRFEGNPDDPGEPYEIYRGLLGALISAAAGMKFWSETNPKRGAFILQDRLKDHLYGLDQPFYRQEILWLYNERALTAFVQGRLYDAVPVFDQALRIARQVTDGGEGDDSFRATERRIMLNLAVTEIERGNIGAARQHLHLLARRSLNPELQSHSFTKELADGYLGLCDHLSGHLKRAESRYLKVLRYAERLESMRTLAIFHCHYADLLRLLKRTDEAQTHVRLATLAAARDEQKDVAHHALIAQARLYRDSGEREALREASRQLDEAERYAKELGLIKLEVQALKARSLIILDQGETEQAGRLAARAISLANRHGMELHKISGLITYGRILMERGQIELAHAVLKECSGEADRRGYQLAAIVADRLMRMSLQPQAADELGTLWVKSSNDS